MGMPQLVGTAVLVTATTTGCSEFCCRGRGEPCACLPRVSCPYRRGCAGGLGSQPGLSATADIAHLPAPRGGLSPTAGLGSGALIAVERERRARMARLRTNALNVIDATRSCCCRPTVRPPQVAIT
jgi:hypothetical protein